MFFEGIKLYERRATLTDEDFRRTVRSPLVWTLAAGLIFGSGFFAWVFYESRENVTALEVAIGGIACRSIIRNILAGIDAGKAPTAGPPRGPASLYLR